MKVYILDNSISLIKNVYPKYTETELCTIRYGLEGIYITITKSIIIFSIAIILNILKELLIIVILYNLLRMFSFGLHANNSVSCLLASSTIFLGSAYIYKILIIPLFIKISISIMCIITFMMFSPADTSKRPIINKKRRAMYKFISTLLVIIYSFIILILTNNFIINALFISMTIQSLLISPLCYKLFNQPYNNYLSWKGVIP